MEELTLYIWSLSETRDMSIGNKTRFPGKSIALKDLETGMDLSERFEWEWLREYYRGLTVEAVGNDSVTIRRGHASITLHKGEVFTSELAKTDNIYIAEYIGLELELK